jgi:hypothetical protein
MPPHPTSWRSILILSPFYLWYSKRSISVRSPHQNPVCTSPLPDTCYVPSPSNSSWFAHPDNVWWGLQIIKLHVMWSSPLSSYLLLRRPKHRPQHPILSHFQPKSLPQCVRPSSRPIQKNRQNYSTACLGLNIFGLKNGKWKILHRMIASYRHSVLK